METETFGLIVLAILVFIFWILFSKPERKRKPHRIKILIPLELRTGKKYVKCKGYSRYRKRNIYKRTELTPYVKGRKVKFWRMILNTNDDFLEDDEFVPVFYKKGRKKRSKRT